ncbi:leucine-rich repeat protein, partial [Eggerthellaceae bacterium 24-137]
MARFARISGRAVVSWVCAGALVLGMVPTAAFAEGAAEAVGDTAAAEQPLSPGRADEAAGAPVVDDGIVREAEKLELTCAADGDGAAIVGYKLVDGEGRTLVEGDAASSVKRSLVKSPQAVTLAMESRAGNDFVYDVPENPNPDLVIPSEVDGRPVTAIGPSAFEDAMWMRSVSLPAGLREIGESAFRGCAQLAAVDVPAGADLGSYAFAGCTALARVSLPEGVTAGGRDRVDEYGDEWREDFSAGVFQGCAALASVEIPGSFGAVGSDAFSGCSALESAAVAEGVESLERDAFEYCGALSSIDLPSTLGSVGDYALHGCRSLAEIALPASVESVGDYAFEGCAPAAPVALPAALSGIGEGAFRFWEGDGGGHWDGESDEWVEDPAPSYGIAPATWAQYWKLSGNARYIDPETTTVTEPDAPQGDVALTYEDNGSGLTVTGCADGFPADLAIPAQHDGKPVTAIGPSAFEDATWMRSVSLPAGLREIGESAFRGCAQLA